MYEINVSNLFKVMKESYRSSNTLFFFVFMLNGKLFISYLSTNLNVDFKNLWGHCFVWEPIHWLRKGQNTRIFISIFFAVSKNISKRCEKHAFFGLYKTIGHNAKRLETWDKSCFMIPFMLSVCLGPVTFYFYKGLSNL